MWIGNNSLFIILLLLLLLQIGPKNLNNINFLIYNIYNNIFLDNFINFHPFNC
jgi:hypothetical protein